jgi:hypothetical protein
VTPSKKDVKDLNKQVTDLADQAAKLAKVKKIS